MEFSATHDQKNCAKSEIMLSVLTGHFCDDFCFIGEQLVRPPASPHPSPRAARNSAHCTQTPGTGGAICERRVESKLQLVDLAGSESVGKI